MSTVSQRDAEQLLTRSIRREVGPSPILLWGSRAVGTATDRSDYDVVVVVPLLRIPLVLRRLRRLASRLALDLGDPVSVNPVPEARLRHQRSLYAWKVAHEARVLAAPEAFDLDSDRAISMTSAHEFSYLASAAMYLLAADGAAHDARKALLHIAQLRLLRRGEYASVLEDALDLLDDRSLSELLSAPDEERFRHVRDEVIAELWPLVRSRGGRRLTTNLRYVLLAGIRGRIHVRAAWSRRRVDHALAEAAVELLVAGKSATARASRLLWWLDINAAATWDAVRDVILREWPDAHPLAAQ